jgi:Fe-S cluster assembly iron-binding protein IscA
MRTRYSLPREGAGFKIENPNVESTCGCGSSFNI